MPALAEEDGRVDEQVDVAFLQDLLVGRLDPDPPSRKTSLRAWLEGERPVMA